MFDLRRGDITRIHEKCVELAKKEGGDAKAPSLETVRTYLNGGNVGVHAARRIDAAYAKLKPVQAAKKAHKQESRARRVSAPVSPEGAAPVGASHNGEGVNHG